MHNPVTSEPRADAPPARRPRRRQDPPSGHHPAGGVYGYDAAGQLIEVTTGAAAWRGAIPQGSRTVLAGTRGGVDIRVIVDSRTGEIMTGYPTNLPRIP